MTFVNTVSLYTWFRANSPRAETNTQKQFNWPVEGLISMASEKRPQSSASLEVIILPLPQHHPSSRPVPSQIFDRNACAPWWFEGKLHFTLEGKRTSGVLVSLHFTTRQALRAFSGTDLQVKSPLQRCIKTDR